MVCGRTAHSALVLRTDEGEIVVPGPVYTDPMAIAAPFDTVFVAVKTTQTEAIAPRLTALCSLTPWCACCKTALSSASSLPLDRRRDGAAVGGLVPGAARCRCLCLVARHAAPDAAGSAGGRAGAAGAGGNPLRGGPGG